MYGGHITDNWDRRTNNTYLKVLIRAEILENMNLTLAPGFRSPDPKKFKRDDYIKFVDEKLDILQLWEKLSQIQFFNAPAGKAEEEEKEKMMLLKKL
jgi:hypothetical protein